MKRKGFLTVILGALTWPLWGKEPTKGNLADMRAGKRLGCDLYYLEQDMRDGANQYKNKFGNWPAYCILGRDEFEMLTRDGYVYGEGFEYDRQDGTPYRSEYYVCANMIVMLAAKRGTNSSGFFPIFPGTPIALENVLKSAKSVTGDTAVTVVHELVMSTKKYRKA